MTLTLYTAPWCNACQMLKQQIKQLNIEYREQNIEEQPNFAIRTLPTIQIQGEYYPQPTITQIKKLLTIN